MGRRTPDVYRAPFPLYAVKVDPKTGLVVTAGGGGASKTGIKNAVVSSQELCGEPGDQLGVEVDPWLATGLVSRTPGWPLLAASCHTWLEVNPDQQTLLPALPGGAAAGRPPVQRQSAPLA